MASSSSSNANATATAATTKPNPKKSVSFSDSASAPSLKTGANTDADADLYRVQRSLFLVPVHLLVEVYLIFQRETNEALGKKALVPLAITQVGYTALLLLPQLYNIKNQKRVRFNIWHLVFAAMAAVVLSAGLFALVVLLGAPFTTPVENFVLALHLSGLIYPGLVIFLRVGLNSISVKTSIAVAVGAWLGAIAIPLDWDRPWQTWPMTIVGGAYLGAFIGYSTIWLF